eukprot:TRINITY_DN12395_c0_g1_i1.p2 TRINITY_DN12395_c0_g1~~TRINITY_DN12395_c0_g1_i1.p2  ORF type:complete len:141 (+),score=10.37 TRINITY_DN12395_c0_g1_i1:342-764(+)
MGGTTVSMENWEGIALRPSRAVRRSRKNITNSARRAPSFEGKWDVFKRDVFSTGHFLPNDTLELMRDGTALSSYGSFRWGYSARAGGATYIVHPRWHAKIEMNKLHTSFMMNRSDGERFVCLRRGLLRTIRERLQSFLFG